MSANLEYDCLVIYICWLYNLVNCDRIVIYTSRNRVWQFRFGRTKEVYNSVSWRDNLRSCLWGWGPALAPTWRGSRTSTTLVQLNNTTNTTEQQHRYNRTQQNNNIGTTEHNRTTTSVQQNTTEQQHRYNRTPNINNVLQINNEPMILNSHK